MAVSFHRGPQTLVKEIKQAGYRIIDISSDIGDLNRSVQVKLKNGVIVNWDRESRSVWTQGPERLSEKIEAYIASRRGRRKPKKESTAISSVCAMLLLVIGLLLALVYENLNGSRSAESTLPQPPANANDAP